MFQLITPQQLAQKTVCFVDNGLFAAFARKVAPAFKKAYYWMPWAKAFVRSRELAVGVGYPEIERIRSPFRKGSRDLTGEVDLWVFLDQFHNDLQWLIENKFGSRVWGARDAEELELYRWEARQAFQNLGLPVLPAAHLIGFDALRQYLKTHEKVWVKNSFKGTAGRPGGGRADMETWFHRSYELSEERLDELEHDLGAIKHVYEFICEADYPHAEEIGYDGPVIDDQFPAQAMQAFEVKGTFMMGTIKPYAELALPVRLVNQKLAPALKGYRYRAMLSTEIRWGNEKKPYLLDPCCRLGSPSNELLQELIGNWPQIMWHGAVGELVQPKVLHLFGCVAMVYSEHSGQNWKALRYPPALDPWVKVRNPTILAGNRYSVPQGAPQNIAGVVGVGKTLLEAARQAAEHASQVKGDRIQVDLGDGAKALEIIRRGEKYGIRFTDQPLPSPQELAQALKG